MADKVFRYDIAVLRFICIAVVVFFHGYGMTYVHFSDEVNEIYRQQYELFNQYGLINVAMPMFTFISGFLFGGQLMHQYPMDFCKMVKSKFMRLMLPFFVFTVIFMFTTNSLSWKPFYEWSYWHLWYLPMLFWCFVICYFLRPLIMSEKAVVYVPTLLLLFGVSLIGKVVPMILGIHNVHLWFCWFSFGAWFYKHESIVSSKIIKSYVSICGGGIYVLISILFPTEYGTASVTEIIALICGIASFWCFAGLFNVSQTAIWEAVLSLSSVSFGIYIFHNWLEIYMVSSTAKRLLPIEQFAMSHTVLFPILFCSAAFVLSYLLSALLLKTKIGRLLIG